MRKGRRRRIGFYTIALVVLILCLVIGVSKLSLDHKYNLLQKQKEALELSIEEEQERRKEIDEYSVYVKTKKFIEDVARNMLGMTYKDDIILKNEAD